MSGLVRAVTAANPSGTERVAAICPPEIDNVQDVACVLLVLRCGNARFVPELGTRKALRIKRLRGE